MSISVEKSSATPGEGTAGNPDADAHRAAARRNARTLAIVVVLIYAGYLVWNVWRSAG